LFFLPRCKRGESIISDFSLQFFDQPINSRFDSRAFAQGKSKASGQSDLRVDRGTGLQGEEGGKRLFDAESFAARYNLNVAQTAIAELAAYGLQCREIAKQCGTTVGSIRMFLHRIYNRVGVESQAQLIVLALGGERAAIRGEELKTSSKHHLWSEVRKHLKLNKPKQ
jgi:DNA-binding CsgD family transcriptional regulator